jgi:hypothetical protein
VKELEACFRTFNSGNVMSERVRQIPSNDHNRVYEGSLDDVKYYIGTGAITTSS